MSVSAVAPLVPFWQVISNLQKLNLRGWGGGGVRVNTAPRALC